jgi:hypothetical protein
MKEKVIDSCWRCGGKMIERESATIITVSCSRKCGSFYTRKKTGSPP